MATHSGILTWKISRTEEPGELQSMGSHRRAWQAIVHGVTKSQTWLSTHTHTHTHTHAHTHTCTHVLNQIRPSALFYFSVRDCKYNVLKHDVLGNNKSKSNYPLCYRAHKPVLRKLAKGFTKIKKYNTVHLPLISFNKIQ